MRRRLQASSRIAFIHFACGILWAVVLAIPVFGLWFQYPYGEIAGGKNFFLVILAVDIVCGPFLTFILYDPDKEKWKWRVDLTIVLVLQIGIMAYGVERLITMRPVLLSFEGDRFRVVRANDISTRQLSEAKSSFANYSWTGPRLIAAKLLPSNDPGYMDSLVRSVNGEPPSFRPSRWEDYNLHLVNIRASLKPLSALSLDEVSRMRLKEIEVKCGCQKSSLGYLPLISNAIDDWVVVVSVESAFPVGYLNIDGW